MRNTDYPYDHSRVYAIWQAYRQNNAPPENTVALDPVIFASWERCKGYFSYTTLSSTPPSSEIAPLLSTDLQDELLAVGLPYLEDIHQCIEGAASAVILTNNHGVVIGIEGEPTTINTVHKIGVAMEENWLESRVGTNAVGLSLITAMPTQVVGAEHYMQIFHNYGTSATTPIKLPLTSWIGAALVP
ncbi:MAG: hypothetical protein AAF125_22880 [Chloroflexota bacterium]